MKSSVNVKLDCVVVGEPHVQSKYGIETIYEVTVSYKRASGSTDDFCLSYSSGLGVSLHDGDYLSVEGSFRSVKYHGKGEEKSRIITKLYILASSITVLDGEPYEYENEVTLRGGRLLRQPVIRKSYNNDNKDIADLVLVVERGFGKQDFIPCAAWNNNARLVCNLKKDTYINIDGRLRSHYTTNGRLMCEVASTYISLCEE